MGDIAIKVENLSKAYQLGDFSTGTLSRDIERWFALARGKEDPFLTVGEENDRSRKGSSDIVWSLRNLNFEIEKGDAVGIIGRNGAGKSTLLKILSRVTSPTTGSAKIRGRIASLLEVGTGFHPELTGQENIYLNGAILGMRKAEIKKHFDAIVDFAGVERYVDTPVKRYSSGMYVRLAFAVAAHLEAEIMIVDEVLAVGDFEFQKKCIGKMSDVSKKEGRTILFVSHNMQAVQELCPKSIFLTNGTIQAIGVTSSLIEQYQNYRGNSRDTFEQEVKNSAVACFKKVFLSDHQNKAINVVDNGVDAFINLEVVINNVNAVSTIAFEIKSVMDVSIYCSHDYDVDRKQSYEQGLNCFRIKLPPLLRPGRYYINLGINGRIFTNVEYIPSALAFEVTGAPANSKSLQDERPGMLYLPLTWSNY